MQQQSVISVDTSGFPSQTFALHLKIREVKAALETLQTVSLLPKKQKKDWVKNNGTIVYDAIDNMVDNSSFIALERFDLEDETVQLSHELITLLRDMVSVMESIMYTEDREIEQLH